MMQRVYVSKMYISDRSSEGIHCDRRQPADEQRAWIVPGDLLSWLRANKERVRKTLMWEKLLGHFLLPKIEISCQDDLCAWRVLFVRSNWAGAATVQGQPYRKLRGWSSQAACQSVNQSDNYDHGVNRGPVSCCVKHTLPHLDALLIDSQAHCRTLRWMVIADKSEAVSSVITADSFLYLIARHVALYRMYVRAVQAAHEPPINLEWVTVAVGQTFPAHLGGPDVFPGQMWYTMRSPHGVQTFLESLRWSHHLQMPTPLQLTFLKVRRSSTVPLFWAPSTLTLPSFSCFYPQSHSFGHYPKLMTTGEGRRKSKALSSSPAAPSPQQSGTMLALLLMLHRSARQSHALFYPRCEQNTETDEPCTRLHSLSTEVTDYIRRAVRVMATVKLWVQKTSLCLLACRDWPIS